jgi:hypothetical protein
VDFICYDDVLVELKALRAIGLHVMSVPEVVTLPEPRIRQSV